MAACARETKVLAALAFSLTAGAIVLLALGNNPPPADAFCLSQYCRLAPVEKVIKLSSGKVARCWQGIDICYAGQCSAFGGLCGASGNSHQSAELNCHFIICNGTGAANGQIRPTSLWLGQQSCGCAAAGEGGDSVIRLCVITDHPAARVTDFQLKRTETLVKVLLLRYEIPEANVVYPPNWLNNCKVERFPLARKD